ncbi:FAD/NAD(P)-binding protein [Cyclobacterium plantarum]|uniref:FAD-dependent urate hydroxylase HpyO/Asp monooxygenase CreE-like FAD/NAD(P)-binding domain-containing protein n=1 Tax=Cyclobacterium plantarum TaxID=2716263 RepID=A0ABX0HBG6_9BACT|nr:FAD/NAD(P)-binding protein [Cyclobacterium plantarum]NHE57502.1 hypothetical protein [Cyclobacterium plantarum]
MNHIAIIGGGACGVAVFVDLFHQIGLSGKPQAFSIHWYEEDEQFGKGLAFGTDQPGHILNTQADLMGIFPEEPDHFAKWLDENGGKSNKAVKGGGKLEDSYTSRNFYGNYLREQMQVYLRHAQNLGLSVVQYKQRAEKIDFEAGKYRITTNEGIMAHLADKVILAVGTPKPNKFSELRSNKNYIDFPWPSNRILKKYREHRNIGILGSSLSAIDTVITLLDNDYAGQIYLFSPDGLMPKVQPVENKNVERKFLTLSNLNRWKRERMQPIPVKLLFRWFLQELEVITGNPVRAKSLNRVGLPADQLLDKDIEWAEKRGDPVVNLAYSLRHEASALWDALSVEEKIKFKKWLGPHWAINRHGMPLHNAYKLKRAFDMGKLKVIPFFENLEEDRGEGANFIMKTVSGASYEVGLLINATGSPGALDQMGNALITYLLEKKLIRSHPVGGAVVNPRTMQLFSPAGGNGIFAVGHLVNGMLMDVNAVWFNVKTVRNLTQEILFRILDGNND